MPVTAVQHIRRMRGGAQAHLMRAIDTSTKDEHLAVVKFANNPQHRRVLANEMIATRLAELIGLPVPVPDLVEVSNSLVSRSPELTIQSAQGSMKCAAGHAFGSRYVPDPAHGTPLEWLCDFRVTEVENLDRFAGMLAFDKWTGNTGKRKAVFWRKSRCDAYTATFIDQGCCFNGGGWSFPDQPMTGTYESALVYRDVRSWEQFEPWLPKIETISDELVWRCARDLPPEWDGATPELERLIETLLKRRKRVRALIDVTRKCSPELFPAWRECIAIREQATGAVN
jgi:hypothetical protein